MALNTVTLKWDLTDLIQAGLSATLSITPTAQLSDTADHVLIPAVTRRVNFTGGTGQLAGIVANDNASILPAYDPPDAPGAGYLISVATADGVVIVPQFQAQLLYANGATQWLDALAVVPSVATAYQFLPQPSGTPAAGQVPAATGTGEASAWGFSGAGATVVVPKPTGLTATDTPNAVAAIASLAANETLLFQDGTYQVDSNALVIRNLSNFAVRSAGRTVIAQAPNRSGLPNNTTGDLFIIADCTDFTVSDLTLDGMRDTVAPLTPLTATAGSGQPSVTVAAGQGSRYQAGQRLALYGGLGSGEQAQQDGEQNGWGGTGLVVASVTPGGGSGGGDLITFTANLAHTYAQVSSTVFSDGFGPYAYAGAYLTPYQAGYLNSVAGRTLSGEDQQNGLHLINCQRFTVTRCTARNTWESPFKAGAGWSGGFDVPNPADGCSQGTISDCTAYHAYDQGVSLWLSSKITVTGCVISASGWSGISMTSSDLCTVTGNSIDGTVYRVPLDTNSGSGISVEGGRYNTVTGNVITSPYQYGIILWGTVLPFGLPGGASNPTIAAFTAAGTAAGASVQVSSTASLQAGGLYSIVDKSHTEAVTVATIVDGTHVTFAEAVKFAHSAGVYFAPRVPQDNLITGNVIDGPQTSNGIINVTAVRTVIGGNVIRRWNAASGGNQGINMVAGTSSAGQFPSSTYLGGDGSRITGNTIGPPGPTGNHHLLIDSSGDHVIEGNHFIGTPSGSTNPLKLQGVYDTVVSANGIHDIGDSTSSSQQGIFLTTGAKNALPCRRVTLTGNVITRTKSEGVIVIGGDSLTVAGNKVSSCGGNAGIDLRGVTNSTVTGNVCDSNAGAGIELESNAGTGCSGNRVTGNTCRDDGTGYNVKTGGAWTQANGILEAAGSNFNLFTGNECDSNGTAQVTTAGASSYAWNNIISGAVAAGTAPAIVPGQYLCAPNAYAPASQALLTATSTSMTAFSPGNACTGSFTAPASGKVLVGASFAAVPSASSQGYAFGLCATGTVTPLFGNSVQFKESQSADQRPYALTFLITGLTPGTAYQFDLMGAVTSGLTVTVAAIGQTSVSPSVGNTGQGAPVIMTVQAV